MSTQKAKNIPDAEWQAHKQILERLWLEEKKKLVGPESVKLIMESKYTFFATKSQYEAQFRKWKWNKNQKSDDWERLAVVIYQRERQNKKSNVFIHGTLQSPGRVQKKIAPHALSIPRQLSSGLDLRLPNYITVRTPTLGKTEWWTSGLPFDAIEGLLRRGTTQSARGIWASPNRPDDPQNMASSLMALDRFDTIDQYQDHLIEAFEMPEPDESVEMGTMVDTTSKLDTSKILDFTALKSVLPQSMIKEGLSCPSADLPSTRECATPGYRQILFSLANNFAGLEDADMKKLFFFLQRTTSQGLIQLIRSNPTYSSRAIAQNIFKGAIEVGDARLIDLLIKEKSLGIDVNRFWCRIEGNRYTPIERASWLRHEEVIKVLLNYHSDVNRTCPDQRTCEGALDYAIGALRAYTRVDSQIFRKLLNAGGDVSRYTLKK